MRYFIQLSYAGTNYHGWQRQPKFNSVQQTIEDMLSVLFSRHISLHGCGRTDAGVHAQKFFAHLDLDEFETHHFLNKANKMLPADIVFLALHPVTPHANAQRDAISRTYQYHLHLIKNPFLEKCSTWLPYTNLDLECMNEASEALPFIQDYSAYCKTPARHKSTLCAITDANWKLKANGQYLFSVSADHFLRGMIRLLVGNMIELGSGKLSLDEFISNLKENRQPHFFKMAPPQGLHLVDIEYTNAVGLFSFRP